MSFDISSTSPKLFLGQEEDNLKSEENQRHDASNKYEESNNKEKDQIEISKQSISNLEKQLEIDEIFRKCSKENLEKKGPRNDSN